MTLGSDKILDDEIRMNCSEFHTIFVVFSLFFVILIHVPLLHYILFEKKNIYIIWGNTSASYTIHMFLLTEESQVEIWKFFFSSKWNIRDIILMLFRSIDTVQRINDIVFHRNSLLLWQFDLCHCFIQFYWFFLRFFHSFSMKTKILL